MRIRLSLQAVAVALVLSAPDALAQPGKTPDELLKGFLAAVQANSYEGMVAPIVAEGGEIADELEKPEQKAANMLSLEKLNRALAPRLAKGYAAISMGMLKYRGYQIYLWKLEYKTAETMTSRTASSRWTGDSATSACVRRDSSRVRTDLNRRGARHEA